MWIPTVREKENKMSNNNSKNTNPVRYASADLSASRKRGWRTKGVKKKTVPERVGENPSEIKKEFHGVKETKMKSLKNNALRFTAIMFFIGMLTLVTNIYAQEEGAFVIDTNFLWGNAFGKQWHPAVCFGDTNYLAVWDDHIGICGTRVSRSPMGQPVLDPARIIISTRIHTGISFGGNCPVACLGDTNYLVVWAEEHLMYGDFVYDRDIYGRLVNKSGEVLGTSSFIISDEHLFQSFPSVSFNGTNWLVVWKDKRNDWNDEIYCARVSQSGEVLDSDGIIISTTATSFSRTEVAFDGTNHLVVWNSGDYVYGRRVSGAGEVLDTADIAIPGDYGHQPSVAFDGTNYLVVYMQLGIRGARIDTSGTVLDPGGFIISTGLNTGWQLNPSVSFNGTNYFVAWEDWWSEMVYSDIYGSIVSTSGEVLISTIPIAIADYKQMDPAVASEGSDWLVVWFDRRGYPDIAEICGSRIDSSGTVLNPQPNAIFVSTGGNGQKFSSACFNGTNYLVAWGDWRDSNLNVKGYELYGTRVDPFGVTLDTTSIAISTASLNQVRPSVATDGTDWFVVWMDSDWAEPLSCRGTRISQSGEVLDPEGILFATGSTEPYFCSVCFGGGVYFVTWRNWHSLYGARVSTSGVILDPGGILISGGADWSDNRPSVCFDGTNFFIVYQSSEGINGVWVSISGEVLDNIAITVGEEFYPVVSFDGTNYLVVWQYWLTGLGNICGLRINQEGEVLDPEPIVISTGGKHPSVSFDGTNFIVAWEYDSVIYGALVSPSGIVIDSFEICTQLGRQFSPDLTSGPGEQVLITWTGWTPNINNQPANTYRIWGKLYPFNVGIEEEVISGTEGFRLYQNFPNPFSASTTISFNIHRRDAKNAELMIYNIKGQLVKQLSIDNRQSSIPWDGKDENGRELSNGIYFYQLQTGDYVETRKLVLLR